MSEINNRLTEELNSIIADRNTIRDALSSEGWGRIAGSYDNLNTLATTISEIPTHGAISEDLTREKGHYAIPKGYHNGTGIVTWIDDLAHDTQEYKLQTGVTVTPKKRESVIVEKSDGFYGLGPVTVNPIPDPYHDVSGVTVTPDKVVEGEKYVDISGTIRVGTMPDNSSSEDFILNEADPEYIIPKGYHDGTQTVYINGQQKTVTPSEVEQNIYPDNNNVLTNVIVNPIPDKYGDVSNCSENASVSEGLLTGLTVIARTPDGDAGEVTGIMPKIADYVDSMDGIYTISVPIPRGYHDGTGKVNFQDATLLELLQSI